MKRLLFLPLLILTAIANAKTYYVAAAGNDNNAGTSTTTAWKSIVKVNSFTFAANDSILFNSGDVFYGSIVVNRNNLTFSAYGTGAKPQISGFSAISAWKALGGGIYEAVVNAKSNLNMVAINGVPQQIGRYPNAIDANGGFLTYQSSGATSITDNQLSSTVDWTGAEVGIRKNLWTLERCIVTSQSGGTINYKAGENINSSNGAPTPQAGSANFGYFFMNDIRTLDQFGEWYFDNTAKKIKVFFGTATPSNYTVEVSTVDTLINIGSRTNINISNLSFQGANLSGIFALHSGFINIQSCDMMNMGVKAIHIFDSPNILIENVNTTNVLSNAIQVINRQQANVTIRNCVVKNTAPFKGMGSYYDDSDNKGIYAVVTNNLLIEYNKVDTVGLAGIQYNGSDVIVRNNVVNYYCYTLDDVGGIYTWVGGTDASPAQSYTNRTVSNNIVMNGIGAPLGTPRTEGITAGIFLDGRSMNVNVFDNTVFNSLKGLHSNNPSSVNIRGNVFYNNKKDISIQRWSWGSISNLTVKKNVSFPINSTQTNFYYVNSALNTPATTTLQSNLKSIGNIDSNYYNTISDAGIVTDIYATDGGALMPNSPFSLDGWRSFTSHDLASKRPAQKIQTYSIINTVGSNLFSNGQFASNINGATVWGTGTTGAWDNTNKVSGGSIRIDFTAPTANKFSLLYGNVGAVSSSKKYVLRFTTLGTSINGIVNAYIRKSASPYDNLIVSQTQSFGLTKIIHEFLFDAPVTETSASFVISIDQNSGTTYIDDIEFVEVNATINSIASQIKFLYNDTKLSKSITLDAKYIGVDSTVYNGVITLAPYSSKVLTKAGPVSGTLPVKLLDFNAHNNNDKVEVNWITTGEINSSYYQVQRSNDGQLFESIARIASNNRADRQSTYGYTDIMPKSGILYYRLAMVDIDGTIAYSKIVAVSLKNSKSLVIENVKLSASASNLRINVNTNESQLMGFAVIDVSGRVVMSKNIQLQGGSNNIITSIPAINKGIYYVKMQTAGVSVTRAVLSE